MEVTSSYSQSGSSFAPAELTGISKSITATCCWCLNPIPPIDDKEMFQVKHLFDKKQVKVRMESSSGAPNNTTRFVFSSSHDTAEAIQRWEYFSSTENCLVNTVHNLSISQSQSYLQSHNNIAGLVPLEPMVVSITDHLKHEI